MIVFQVDFELLLSNLEIHHLIEGYPITPKDHGIEYLMNHRHLWIRSKRQHAILRIRHEIIKATRDFFDSNDFTLVDTPIFTSNACEGTTTLFNIIVNVKVDSDNERNTFNYIY